MTDAICRPALIGSAHNDHDSDNSFGNEKNIESLLPLHGLLNATGCLQIAYRPGDHVGLIDVNLYYDWFAIHNKGRRDTAIHVAGHVGQQQQQQWQQQQSSFGAVPLRLHSFDWNAWLAAAGSIPPPPVPSAPLAERVQWVMGEKPLVALGGHGCAASTFCIF